MLTYSATKVGPLLLNSSLKSRLWIKQKPCWLLSILGKSTSSYLDTLFLMDLLSWYSVLRVEDPDRLDFLHELVVELVFSFVQSWLAQINTSPFWRWEWFPLIRNSQVLSCLVERYALVGPADGLILILWTFLNIRMGCLIGLLFFLVK